MKSIYIKLAASIMSIIVAFTMVVGATYAWLVLSKSPAVNGISVSLSGGSTILLAADITEVLTDAEGTEVIVHYPGEFTNSLNFAEYDTYDYLNHVSGLSPVSTADGLYWILPSYDEKTGVLKAARDFLVDDSLEYANVTESQEGNYIYLDFWVVSPGTEYSLRVSKDTKNDAGTYLIELPGVEETEDGSFKLAQVQGIVEASARVGFLVNTDTAGTADMASYVTDEAYNTQYKSLQGVYPEKGQTPKGEYALTIYEPNGTSHPGDALQDGDYMITRPLRYDPYGKAIVEEDVSDRLMVQEANRFRMLEENVWLEQIFQAAIAKRTNDTTDTAAAYFYNEYLQGQVDTYVHSGNFYKKTADLYAAAENGVVSAESLEGMSAGATDDCYITILPKNTPQRIRMYIWLEGQDADCTANNRVEASSFSLKLEFSGADQ